MDRFCHLYLLMILLMRSGDIETNPGPNTPESIVSEDEFLKLSGLIDSPYYKHVGVKLQIPWAQLSDIKRQSDDISEAFMNVFMKWKVRQLPGTNIRAILAEKLKESGLGNLSGRVRNGSLISNATGEPSRPPESQTQPPSAESRTEPLSPELIERCANDFKFKYRSTLCKIRADPLNPASLVGFEKLYTNLVLEEEDGTGKQTLDYNDLHDLNVNGEFPKRLMVQGEAGAGKTTLCAKIAWDWIKGRHFSHFVWVLIVPLRESKQYTLGEIAKSYLAKNNPATVSQITEYIRSNPDKVFIAFDGLDEFSGKVIKEGKESLKSECHQSQSTEQSKPLVRGSKKNTKSKIKLNVMQHHTSHTARATLHPRVDTSEASSSHLQRGEIKLEDILSSDQLASCPVLVTTRPWRAIEIRSDNKLSQLYTFIHVQGFSKENLSVYIHKYFPYDNARANQLIQFVDENDVISENMAHYPIYVAMLCLMWRELSEKKLKEIKSLQTFSQIFKEMIAFLKEHYAQKKINKVGSPSLIAYLKEIDELLQPIAKQAFTALLENTLIFSEGDFQICPESKEIACRVGILSQEDRITCTVDVPKNSHVLLPVFFPHKLFQEYMAGVYLASLYESDHNEFNKLINDVVLPRKEELRYLLYFTVSQNNAVATHVMNCMVPGNVQRDIDFIVDVAFESQDPDVAALVKDRVSSEEMKLSIGRFTTAHTVAGYAFTRPPVVELTVRRNCGPTMSLDVAEMICSIPSMKLAVLPCESFHCDFFVKLASKGKESQVQTLSLNVRCPTPASSHHLAEALCSMPNLNYLILQGMDLHEEFYSTLKAKASSIQVQTLSLHDISCPTPASSHHLAEALCSMPNLNDLTLDGKHLNEEFCSTLKAKGSSIQVCFPQIRKGNFKFHGCVQQDLTSFLNTLAACIRPAQSQQWRVPMLSADHPEQPTDNMHSSYQLPPPASDITGTNPTCQGYPAYQPTYPSHRQPLGGSYHGNAYITTNVSSEQSRAMFQDDMSSTSIVNPAHADITVIPYTLPRGLGINIPVFQGSHDNLPVRQHLQHTGSLRNQVDSQPMYRWSNAIPGNPGLSQPQVMPSMSAGYHTTAPFWRPFSETSCHPGYREPDYNPSYKASMSRHAPSPNPQVSGYDQATMSTGSVIPTHQPERAVSTTMPGSSQDHYTQFYHVSTSSSDPLCNAPVSGYHQSTMPRLHISDAALQQVVQERTDSSSRPGSSSQLSHSTNFLFPNQSASSTAHLIHTNSTSDTVGQFSKTYSEGSSSQSRPHKRQAPSTQSRVPQEDPEIPEKQSKYGV